MDIINAVAFSSQSTLLPTVASVNLPRVAPDALATAQFAQIMAAPQTAASTVIQEGQAVAVAPNVPRTNESASLGDRILQGLENLSTEFRGSMNSVETALKANVTQAQNLQDMLLLQHQLIRVSYQFDLIGKAVSRATQNIDQLVRMQ